MFRITVLLLIFCLVKSEYVAVSNLDLNSYIGEWYEVYEDNFDKTFQNGKCVKAFYKLNENNVSVLNTQIKDNKIDSINGYAFYKEGDSGGYLTVQLDDLPEAPYWVIELGPIKNNLYDYAIVSDNIRLSLFVLARNVSTFFNLYDEKVLKSLENFGFSNRLNSPIMVDQTDC